MIIIDKIKIIIKIKILTMKIGIKNITITIIQIMIIFKKRKCLESRDIKIDHLHIHALVQNQGIYF